MNLGGKTTKYRLVPRAPGDATPLQPAVVEALRKAGKDPSQYALAPYEEGETSTPLAGLLKDGARVEHAFLFGTINGALSAIEKLVDDTTPARITKTAEGWLVVFDAVDRPDESAATAHQRFADLSVRLGAQDRGFSHVTMSHFEKKL